MGQENALESMGQENALESMGQENALESMGQENALESGPVLPTGLHVSEQYGARECTSVKYC